MPDRVKGYIDGFNLYFGLRAKGWRRFYWLDAWKLLENLLKPEQGLAGVSYFTARLSGSSGKRLRQKRLLEAYAAMGRCEVHFGKFLETRYRCGRCGTESLLPSEKMTDVNIAVELLADAIQDRYDTALIISGDSDLTPAVRKVKLLFPGKHVVVAFPPSRFSRLLCESADGYFIIGRAKLAASQLPEKIEYQGRILERPQSWRA